MKTALKILSIFLIIISSLLAMAVISNFTDGTDLKSPILSFVVAFIMVGIPLGVGILLWKKAAAIKVKTLSEQYENTILEEVRRNGGRITPVELAMKTRLSINEAKQALEQMQQAGHAEVNVTEAGALVYSFSGLSGK